MLPTPPIDERTLSKILSDRGAGPAIDGPWPCDVIGATAALIGQHNEHRRRQGQPVEDKFRDPASRPTRLRELLWADYDALCRGQPALMEHAGAFVITEVARPYPSAFILAAASATRVVPIVCFPSPLLRFIHSAFSKVATLIDDEVTAGCLPEHEAALRGEAYTDTSLLAGLFNDVELIFASESLGVPIRPPHLAAPYDYCEFVEGARRFVLAHELSHAFYPNAPEVTAHLAALGVPPERAARWAEELWCDYSAVHMLVDSYEASRRGEPQRWELQNMLVGVLMLFAIWDVARLAVDLHTRMDGDHPPAMLRLHYVRSTLKRTVVQRHPWLADPMGSAWQRVNAFHDFAGGFDYGPAHGRSWNRADFYRRLTPFGLRIYQAVFRQAAVDLQSRYGGDREARRRDLRHL